MDELIQELLHLNANQFAQIVLLPQGEFRTFLIAKSDEKKRFCVIYSEQNCISCSAKI